MSKETERSAEMRRLIEEYVGSGLGRKDFCERHGVALTTFDYWRRELNGKPRMMEVKVAAGEPVMHFALILANGRRIESPWRFADAELTRLIRVVESA